jgi:hypothetical protein
LQIQLHTDATSQAGDLINADFVGEHVRLVLAGAPADLLNLDHSQVLNTIRGMRAGGGPVTVAAYSLTGSGDGHAGDGHLGDGDADRRGRAIEQFKRLIEVASQRAVERISIAPAMVAAHYPTHASYQDAFNRVTEAMEPLTRLADRCGVRISVRAAAAGFLTSPPELREWITRLNSPALGVELDTRDREDLAAWPDWLATLEPVVDALGVRFDSAGGVAAAEGALHPIRERLTMVDLMSPYGKAVVLRPE